METKYVIALIIGIGIYASTISALYKVYKPRIKAKKERQEKLKKERERVVKARILIEEKNKLAHEETSIEDKDKATSNISSSERDHEN